MGVPGNANTLLLRTAAAAGGYQVSRSLRFNSADSAYLSRTPASAGNRTTWSFSCWVKRSKLGTTQRFFNGTASTADNDWTSLHFNSSDQLTVGGYSTIFRTSNSVYRDCSAWYHIVVIADLGNGSDALKFRAWVNNSEVTWSSTSSNPSTTGINAANNHSIGAEQSPNNGGVGSYCNLYLAEIWFLDGIAATPSDFAETDATTGQWIPKAYTGSKGTNGFHLEFADNSAATATTLGKDTSGNGLNWTPNNFSVTAGAGNDSLVDSITSYGTDTGAGGEVRGNYCTLNPIAASAHTYTNGNLDLTISTSSYNSVPPAVGTIAVKSGKWYFEFVKTSGAADAQMGIIATESYPFNGGVGNTATSYAFYLYDGKKINNSTQSSYGNAVATNDIVGVALDLDNGKIWFSKNGTWQASGDPAAGTNAAFTGISSSYTYAPAVSKDTTGTNTLSGTFNFGQRAFAYTAPSGFKALVDTNLTAPVIAKSDQAFQTVIWTGNGSSGRTVTGLNFSPDLVWIKRRDSGNGHLLQDVIRGTGVYLSSNSTAADTTTGGTGSSSAGIQSFDTSGFTLGTGDAVNANAGTYVGWAFDAGTSTVTNGSGSITASVRANPSSGFSIISFTAPSSRGDYTIGHGLGAAPHFAIWKNRSSQSATGYWGIYHKSVMTDVKQYLSFDTSALATSGTNMLGSSLANWNSTTMGISIRDDRIDQNSTGIIYAWTPIAGYSSFGSYVGNGSTDGVFVFTGHQSRWLMVKRTDTTSQWSIWDTARNTYNASGTNLWAESSEAEFTSSNYDVDFLSNGFKMRNTHAARNASGGTYIYISFAQNPFQYARAR